MAIGNTYSTFSFGFANADAYRVAVAARGAEETVSEAVRQAAQDQRLVVGTTITARYKYRVAEDGSFIPVSTQVTAEQAEDALTKQGGRQPRRSYRDDERRPSFADFMRPRATLSPTDEMEIFAAFSNPATPFGIPLRTNYKGQLGFTTPLPSPAQATDENGEAIEAELLAPETPVTLNTATNRAQTAVADLYARNRDLIYAGYAQAGFAA